MSLTAPSGVTQTQGLAEDSIAHYTLLIVRFLQEIFRVNPTGSYHWDEDDKLTEIIISEQATLNREVVEKRPAILVARGPWSAGNISMDQRENVDFRTGKRRFTDLISMTMQISCLSREGLEAQRIAKLCVFSIRSMKRTLMRAGLHRVGEEIQVGAESAPGTIVQADPGEIILVPVSVPIWYQESWTVEPIDVPFLKKLKLGLHAEVTSTAMANRPNIFGQIIPYVSTTDLDQQVLVDDEVPKPRD